MVRKTALTICASLLVAAPALASWQYSETTDAMTDKKYARAFAIGESGGVAVKCDQQGPKSLYISFVSVKYLGSVSSPRRNATYRFDTDPPITESWIYTTQSAINSDQKIVWAFIDRLRSAKSLVVRVSDFNYAEYTNVIDVTGAAPDIDKVIATCGAIRDAK